MIGSVYWDAVYVDAGWGMHHLVRKIAGRVRDELTRIILRIVGAVYSGTTSSSRHFDKSMKGVIQPKGIQVENIWTNYGTGTAVTCGINVADVSNSCVVAVVIGDAGYAFSNAALGGSAMTTAAYGYSTDLAGIYYIVNPTTGAATFTGTTAASMPWRVVCFQLSGVSQTAPLVDGDTTYANPTTSLSLTLDSIPHGLLIDGIQNSTAAGSGQTITTVNSKQCCGYLQTDDVSVVSSYTMASTHYRLSAATFNPA